MKVRITLLLLLIVGFLQSQILKSNQIWNKMFISNNNDWKNWVIQKGFTLQYTKSKEKGGTLFCYTSFQHHEQLLVHESKNKVEQVSYYLPTLKKYLKNSIDKKQLLIGEAYSPQGKTKY